MAIKTRDYVLVGPDNGVLSLALRREKTVQIRRLENDQYFRKPVSNTFHVRDVFASVAAHLTRDIPFDAVGEKLTDYLRLAWPEPEADGSTVHGETLYIDRFGNAITNIESTVVIGMAAAVACGELSSHKLCVPRKLECDLVNFYQQAAAGQRWPLSVRVVSSKSLSTAVAPRASSASKSVMWSKSSAVGDKKFP